jgi:hypothetical protein
MTTLYVFLLVVAFLVFVLLPIAVFRSGGKEDRNWNRDEWEEQYEEERQKDTDSEEAQ